MKVALLSFCFAQFRIVIGKLSVFGHGDCWTPNFLTRYSAEGAPEGIKIIDFQLARYASVGLDISFFIYSCTDQKLREEHYEQLLKV